MVRGRFLLLKMRCAMVRSDFSVLKTGSALVRGGLPKMAQRVERVRDAYVFINNWIILRIFAVHRKE